MLIHHISSIFSHYDHSYCQDHFHDKPDLDISLLLVAVRQFSKRLNNFMCLLRPLPPAFSSYTAMSFDLPCVIGIGLQNCLSEIVTICGDCDQMAVWVQGLGSQWRQ